MSKLNFQSHEFYDISLNDTEFLNSQITKIDHALSTNCDKKIIPTVSEKSTNAKKKPRINEVETSTTSKLCTSLSAWGLPENILVKYKERGISDMFTWQVECLGNQKVLELNRNLVYSAPTSAGKTLVAEILALKTVLEKKKKVIVILPFVSVVREKMFYFQDILSFSGIRVEGFMGSHNPPGGIKAVQLAICTIEKANSIVNKLLEEGSLKDIGAVVIDEMHLLGDSSRGYLLELLLTKLRYMTAQNKEIEIQLIGMSATLSNLGLLAKWLDAELYTTNFRPIPLCEYSLVSGEIYNNEFKLQRRLEKTPDLVEDTDNILQLCLETISQSCSILIFCPTKNWCENLAQQISVAFWKLGRTKSRFGQCLREQLNSDAIAEILEQLKRCPVGLDSVLKKAVSFGVAFHHAGLTMDERDIIEGAFRNGALRVLVATSTLSSGVNLPAQRVIIRTPMFHGKPIDTLTYRQMIGRAGRMGKDTSGESILVCQKTDKRIAGELMSAKLQPIESCLEGAGKLKRAILEVIASGVATTPEDVRLFTNCTLLAASVDGNLGENNPIDSSLEFLVNNEFIRLQKNEQGELNYVATSLAKACLSSSLPPEDGLALFEEIEKARQCFVLDTELHLLYLVTPYSLCSQWSNLDWMLFLNIWEKLPPSMRRVAELVGVRESFIFNATRGRINTSTTKQFHKLQIHRRFYTALALQDLVNEIPLNDVASKFQCNRGMLQSLQQSASMFAGMVTSFCSQLGWKCVEILISQFQDRLQFGIHHELLDLMKLPSLNGPRARALYNAGIETLTDLASFDVCKLENILHSSVPFESERERDGETVHDVEQKKKIRSIWITGKQGLTAREAASMLIKEARKYLQFEIGAAIMKWDSTETEDNSNLPQATIPTSESNSFYSTSSLISEQELNEKDQKIKDTSKLIKAEEKRDYISNNLEQKLAENDPLITNIETNKSKDLIDLSFISDGSDLQNENILSITNQSTEEQNKSIDDIIDNCYSESILGDSLNDDCKNIKTSPSQDKIDNEATDFNWTPMENDIPSFSTSFSRASPKFSGTYSDKEASLNNQNILNSTKSSNKSDSLFEDSIYFDSQLCAALDSSITNDALSNDNNQELKMGDSSFFNQPFESFNIKEQIQDEPVLKETEDVLNVNDDLSDVVETSQSDFNDCTSYSVQSSIKKYKKSGSPTPRKRSRTNDNLVDKNIQCEGTPKKKQKCSEKKNVNIKNRNETCKNENYSQHLKNEISAPVNLTSLDIIDVCGNKELFTSFCKELNTKSEISFALSCERLEQLNKIIIGQHLLKQNEDTNKLEDRIIVDDRHITGMAVSWGGNTVYYICLINRELVSNEDKIKCVQTFFQNPNIKTRIFDYKEHLKMLYKACKISFNCNSEDPKIADWLLEPEGKEKNLQSMAVKYAPEAVGISKLAGSCKGVGSIALDISSAIIGRVRASVEAIITWNVIDSLREKLAEQNIKLLNTFQTEMKSISCLSKMELIGFGVDNIEINNLISTMQEQMASLQQQAFTLAGRRFSFTSSKDVAKVLGLYKGKKVSTNKQTLEQNQNPISNLILQWRKLSCTLTKMLFPIIRSLKNNRIHGCCVTHTSTGRISMHEPNLQNVARNFEIKKSDKSIVPLSVRASFVPTEGNIFLSADYCQLELRILAHLSQDSVLCNIMRIGSDVFKLIAAKLNKIPESQVTDVMRQRAKQLCYGIIYGMGTKALSEQLGSSEEEALEFMESFKNTYPNIQQYIQRTIDACKDSGYVETLAGRRRYLQHINNENSAIKSQAERQAVNTTIQGSAADIAKSAMVLVESQLRKYFPRNNNTNESRVSLVLHLHDELLYEVPLNDLEYVAKIVKKTMETAVPLSIPFPVKLKSGLSWGTLEEICV